MHVVPPSRSNLNRVSIQDFPVELQQKIQRIHLSESDYLFREGDPSEAIYFLESGLIRLFNDTSSGKTIDHYSVLEGEFLGEVMIIVPKCSCSATAIKPSEVLSIPKDAWLQALHSHQSLAITFIGELTHRLLWLKVLLQLRGIKAAQERVWQYLQIIANPETNSITLDRPLKAIAYELDLTPETLSRALGRLAAENLIKRDPRQIWLLNM